MKIIDALCSSEKECCGCGACYAVCPTNAIQMEEKKYGFVFPNIDTQLCIECKSCLKACGFKHDLQKSINH